MVATAAPSPLEKLMQRLSRQFSRSGGGGGAAGGGGQRPPDAAASALGREIGKHFGVANQGEVWRAFVRSSSSGGGGGGGGGGATTAPPPSVYHAFFDVIMDKMRGDMTQPSFDWVPLWILQTEDAIVNRNSSGGGSSKGDSSGGGGACGLRNLLDASTRAYAFHVVTQLHQQLLALNDDDPLLFGGTGGSNSDAVVPRQRQVQQSVLDVYRRLNLESSRQRLLRAVADAAFRNHQEVVGWTVPSSLSPLLAVSVLADSTSSSASSPSAMSVSTGQQDRTAALALIWRNLWMVWTSPDVSEDDCFALLDWMSSALRIHLDVQAGAAATGDDDLMMSAVPSAMQLAESWFVELCFLSQALCRRPLQQQQQQQPEGGSGSDLQRQQQLELLDEWLGEALYEAIPRLLGVCPYNDQAPLVNGLSDVLALSSEQFRIDASTAIRLSVATLMTASPSDRVRLLELLRHQQLRPDSRAALSVLRSVACICVQDDGCRAAALELQDCLLSESSALGEERAKNTSDSAASRTGNLMQLLEDGGGSNVSSLVRGVAKMCNFDDTSCSDAQQIAALLFGIHLLDLDNKNSRRDDDGLGFCFLSNLLAHAPHLAISLLPIVMERIGRASQAGDGPLLLEYMEFLCTSLARDPHCAQEIWYWMGGKLMQADIALRVAVIRLLPKLCDANRRLYRRVIESLESAVTHRQTEIRLAVAATLSDLARNDAVKDVSDVIGWIQGLLTEERLTPMHSLLVHCAIMSLHHLVVAQDLDFDVVIKVLNKRLCSVSDFESVLELPAVIQEALVLLLGDGECDGGSDSDEDDDEGPSVPTVSPQVSSAVRTLVRLGASLLERPKLDANQAKTLENIFTSLSGYSLEALSLNAEGVQAVMSNLESGDGPSSVPEDGLRYMHLRDLVVGGLKISLSIENKGDADDPRVILARKLLRFEEEVIGASLWKKHGTRSKAKATSIVTKQTQSTTSVLPEPSEVQSLANSKPSPTSAIAMLGLIDGSSLKLNTIRDNGDAALESSDPIFLVFVLQSYLHAAISLVSKTPKDEIGSLLAEIRSWHQVFVSPDTMYLTLTAISMYIPHDLRDKSTPDDASIVDDVYRVVMEAFKSSRFENEVVGKICLGLAAVSTVRSGSIDPVLETVDILMQSVKAFGGRKCFGAYYGMAMVCQSLQNYIESDILEDVMDDVRMTIFRITAFLVEELLSCYEERDDIKLVACLKMGAATPDLVESMTDLDVNSISLLMTKQVIARHLFISCSLCLPGLATLNGALHLATLRLLEAFEWGGGKGLVLAPMLRSCEETGLFDEEELKQIYTSLAETFEERMDGGATGACPGDVEDIFLALNATQTKPSHHLLRRALVGNKGLFDEDGRVLTLIAAVVSVAKLPCLSGTPYFAVQAQLRSEVSRNDVTSIIGIVRGAIMSGSDKFAGMGMILLAMFASMKQSSEFSEEVAQQTTASAASVKSVNRGDDEESRALDFEKMTSPRAGTVVSELLKHIENVVESTSSKSHFQVTRILSALECLSLPESLAKSFLEPMMRLSDDGPVTLASVSLLCSQVRGRRRAVFSGGEFVQSVLALSNNTPEDWNRESLHIFVKKLPEMMKKLPPESTESALENVWCSCLAAVGDDRSLVVSFLASARELARNAALSPTTAKALRQVIRRASKDIPEYPLVMLTRKSKDTPSILESFVMCLQELPLETIEEDDYVNFLKSLEGFDSEVVKVLSLIALVKVDYFSSPERETGALSRVASWISKKLQMPPTEQQVDYYALRQVIISCAGATTKEGSTTLKDRLFTLLEVLLLSRKPASRIAFEWLAAVMAHWCKRRGSDVQITLGFLLTGSPDLPQTLSHQDIEDYLRVLIEDLPYNLAVFAFHKRVTPDVSNQLHRLLAHWSDLGVESDILACIRKSIFACQSGCPSDDASFTSLVSTTLSTQRGADVSDLEIG